VGDLDVDVRRALGVVDVGDDVPPAAEVVATLLDGLADPGRVLSAVQCLRAWRWLAGAQGVDTIAPQRVRVLDGAGSRVVDPGEAVVVDDPRWLQRDDLGGLVVAPAGRAEPLADLLDLDLASERADGRVTSHGRVVPVPDAVHALLPE